MPKKEIRILQLIDSLEAGGAERMAVTIANTLAKKVVFSGLVVTRFEGNLKATINDSVAYSFLKKKRTLDIKALLQLKKNVKQNKVSIIHAHGSSYFFAVLLKLMLPSIKIFWHDHLGNRPFENRSNFFIKLSSFFFSGVFVVNEELRKWSLQNLKTTNVVFLPNYVEEKIVEIKSTFLKGEEGKRIVLLANLRHPKNHLLAFEAFTLSEIAKLGWTLHFVGKDSFDEYSGKLKESIQLKNMSSSVFLYGSCGDVQHVLSQCSVGLMTSTYEGFPVTLLEYGKANLLVVTSNVGYCSQLIKNKVTGICFTSESVTELVSIFSAIANNMYSNSLLANNLNTFVAENYSSKAVIKKLLFSYKETL